MANKIRKDFNAMVKDSKNIPKYAKNTDKASDSRDNMVSILSIAYDEFISKMPYGKLVTVGEIRDYFAKMNNE